VLPDTQDLLPQEELGNQKPRQKVRPQLLQLAPMPKGELPQAPMPKGEMPQAPMPKGEMPQMLMQLLVRVVLLHLQVEAALVLQITGFLQLTEVGQ